MHGAPGSNRSMAVHASNPTKGRWRQEARERNHPRLHGKFKASLVSGFLSQAGLHSKTLSWKKTMKAGRARL